MATEPPAVPPVTLSKPPPAATAAQMLADNVATRAREITAIVAYLLMAKWHLVPGEMTAVLIAAIVLPIGITRELAKVGVAKAVSGTAGRTTALLIVAGLAYQLRDLLTYAAPLVGAAAASNALLGGS